MSSSATSVVEVAPDRFLVHLDPVLTAGVPVVGYVSPIGDADVGSVYEWSVSCGRQPMADGQLLGPAELYVPTTSCGVRVGGSTRGFGAVVLTNSVAGDLVVRSFDDGGERRDPPRIPATIPWTVDGRPLAHRARSSTADAQLMPAPVAHQSRLGATTHVAVWDGPTLGTGRVVAVGSDGASLAALMSLLLTMVWDAFRSDPGTEPCRVRVEQDRLMARFEQSRSELRESKARLEAASTAAERAELAVEVELWSRALLLATERIT